MQLVFDQTFRFWARPPPSVGPFVILLSTHAESFRLAATVFLSSSKHPADQSVAKNVLAGRKQGWSVKLYKFKTKQQKTDWHLRIYTDSRP